MKTGKRLLAALLVLLMLAAITPAAFAETPTYHVRIYAGNPEVGKLEVGTDGTVYEQDLPYGDSVEFTDDMVKMVDKRYYAKGIREAGLDNQGNYGRSFTISRDIDYVVAYGMKSTAVQYTVQYLDTAGRELAASRTYYGNVGDHPVVAYLYIEGYQPNALALTKTLSDDPTKNIFPFTYTAKPVTTTTTVVPGGAGNAGNWANIGGLAGNPGNTADGLNIPDLPAPEEILDLDVPLAGPDTSATPRPAFTPRPAYYEPARLPGWVVFFLTALIAALITGAIVLFLEFRRRKKGQNPEEDLIPENGADPDEKTDET